jgi:hypothetical protein
VKCAQCPAPGRVTVTFAVVGRGRALQHVKIHFCSVQCAYWGGIQHARTGFATKLTALRKLYPASLEVLP